VVENPEEKKVRGFHVTAGGICLITPEMIERLG